MSSIPNTTQSLIPGVLTKNSYESYQAFYEEMCRVTSISAQAGENGKDGTSGESGKSTVATEVITPIPEGVGNIDVKTNAGIVQLYNDSETPTIYITGRRGNVVYLSEDTTTANYYVKVTTFS